VVETSPALLTELLRRPSDRALALAWRFSGLGSGQGLWPLGLRRGVINAEFAASWLPAVPLLLRSTGGLDAVRLKVGLAAWLIGGNIPGFELTLSAAELADLVDLPPQADRVPRVRDALAFLAREGFIELENRPGRPGLIRLLSDSGSGEPYQPPWEQAVPYIELPPHFLAKGWLSALSGPALAALLIIADTEVGIFGRHRGFPVTIWTRLRRERYVVSDDTWQDGLRELRDHELAQVTLRRVDDGEPGGPFRYEVVLSYEAFARRPERARWRPHRRHIRGYGEDDSPF